MTDGIKTIEYETIGSTNAEAKRYALSANSHEPVLFVAKEQSAGRGRLGRSFLSRRGQGIYMSLLYFTEETARDAVSVTSAAAVIVAKAIEDATCSPMKIKWVNDIYSAHGKVAGILAESVCLDGVTAMVVGVGINVGDIEFPNELCGIAASIGEISDEKKAHLVDSIVMGLLTHAENCRDNSFMDEYRKRSMLDGEFVELFCAGESAGRGRVIGIDDNGGLVMIFDGESEPTVVRTGEVSVRKIK